MMSIALSPMNQPILAHPAILRISTDGPERPIRLQSGALLGVRPSGEDSLPATELTVRVLNQADLVALFVELREQRIRVRAVEYLGPAQSNRSLRVVGGRCAGKSRKRLTPFVHG